MGAIEIKNGCGYDYVSENASIKGNIPIESKNLLYPEFRLCADCSGEIKYEYNCSNIKSIFETYGLKDKFINCLLGKIAEAVIVRRFNIDYKGNTYIKQKYIKLASNKDNTKPECYELEGGWKGDWLEKAWSKKALLNRVKKKSDSKWHLSESEIKKFIKLNISLMTISNTSKSYSLGTMVARNGLFFSYDYLFNYFDSKNAYEKAPIIYFGINDDYKDLVDKLEDDYNFDTYRSVDRSILNQKFFNAKTFDESTYNEVCKYANLVMDFVDGKLTISELLNHKDVINNKTFKNAIISTALTLMEIPNIIVADDDDDVLDENNN